MTTFIQVTAGFIATLLLSCGSQPGDKTNNHSKDSTIGNSKTARSVDRSRSFVKNYGADDSNCLFAFVGEKIAVEPLPHERGSMDNAFKATYLILLKVYGNFPRDTIEFVAYDHYGTPPFSKFKNALLYVSADSGFYFHQKYMYNDVYKATDGRWAGTYADDYDHAYNKHTKTKPLKNKFC